MRPIPRRADSVFLSAMQSRGLQGGQGCALTPPRPGQRGFTLVELVLVIALAGVVAVMISTVLSRPLQGFVDQSRRAELTDQAATALQRMIRELRGAVPNSPRESAGGLAFLPIIELGRYRGGLDAEGLLQDPPVCAASPCRIEMETPLDAERVSEARWLIIYNVGAASAGQPTAGQNLWHLADPGVRSPADARFAWVTAGEQRNLEIQGATGFRFAFASPQRRLFLAREAVRYRCTGNLATGQGVLWRETFDTLDLAKAPVARSPLADAVSRCEFHHQPGSHSRNALITLRLSLSRDGETISLVQQVHIDNAP